MIPPAFALGSVVLDCLLVTTILRFGLLAGVTTAIGTDVMLVVALLLILGYALRGVLGGRDVARVREQ